MTAKTAMLDNKQVVALAPDVVLKRIGHEALILRLDDEVAFSLNETGTRIAELIAEGLPLGAITNTLCNEYATARADVDDAVRSLVETLMNQRLVVPVRGTTRV